ncbi:MAG: hypothetical protein ABWZ79_02300 [Pedobacter agri]
MLNQISNTRWSKILIYILLFFFISGTFLYYKGSQRINSYQFRGIVTDLTYGRNQISSVTVDGKVYKYIAVEFFKDKIAIGDSLIKNKNSNGMTLIKKNTNEKMALKFEDATGYVEYD